MILFYLIAGTRRAWEREFSSSYTISNTTVYLAYSTILREAFETALIGEETTAELVVVFTDLSVDSLSEDSSGT